MAVKIEVMSIIGANAVAELAIAMAQDGTTLWPHVTKALPAQQKKNWNNRFGLGLTHQPRTIHERKKRYKSTYYGKFSRGAGVGPSKPYFGWTNALRKATEKATKTTPKLYRVDADKNYTGPMSRKGISAPFKDIVDPVVGDRVWDEDALDRRMEFILKNWMNNTLLPNVQKKAARFSP